MSLKSRLVLRLFLGLVIVAAMVRTYIRKQEMTQHDSMVTTQLCATVGRERADSVKPTKAASHRALMPRALRRGVPVDRPRAHEAIGFLSLGRSLCGL